MHATPINDHELLADLLRLDLSPAELARQHGLALDDLLDWFDSPAIQRLLERLERFLDRRDRLAAAARRHRAIAALDLLLDAELAETPPEGNGPRAVSLRMRQRDSLRRVASALTRAAAAPSRAHRAAKPNVLKEPSPDPHGAPSAPDADPEGSPAGPAPKDNDNAESAVVVKPASDSTQPHPQKPSSPIGPAP